MQSMSLTDPVSDFLARIRNAIKARHQKVDVPASKLKVEIARILKEEGYIANFKPTEEEGRSRTWRVFPVPAAACTWAATRSRACWEVWGSTS
jgi:ribosomal protein S8